MCWCPIQFPDYARVDANGFYNYYKIVEEKVAFSESLFQQTHSFAPKIHQFPNKSDNKFHDNRDKHPIISTSSN